MRLQSCRAGVVASTGPTGSRHDVGFAVTQNSSLMRSAWLKWARGVEHQQVLARSQRESLRSDIGSRYMRCDNASYTDDEFIRMHWHLAEAFPIPERWGILLGDVFSNFRAALDHSMWAAVVKKCGIPKRPSIVQFPIVTTEENLARSRKELAPLVENDVWSLIEEVQPHRLEDPQKHPLETLRWGSNVDKHRFLHVAAQAVVDVGPVVVRPDAHDLEVVDEWRLPRHAAAGDVVAGLTLRRPLVNQGLMVGPTFAHTFELQIAEKPVAWAPLVDVMEVVNNAVLALLGRFSSLIGEDLPDPGSLELGLEHAEVAAEFGGLSLSWNQP